MTPWITLALATLLGLSAAGLDPVLLRTPWAHLGNVFHPGHPIFLATLALTLMLAAVPLELKVGRAALLASWSLPALLIFWSYGSAGPELSAFSLLVSLAYLSYRRRERLPWLVWAPLLLAQGLTLVGLQPPLAALAISLVSGLAVGHFARSEAVQVLGMAGGGALLLAWLS